ncbi:MAG TPA: tetratricopeptide repeat protein [Planctomycetota bacterium]|nr:tetratricopeptide repeat protein [Planctomycetota bacterium]
MRRTVPGLTLLALLAPSACQKKEPPPPPPQPVVQAPLTGPPPAAPRTPHPPPSPAAPRLSKTPAPLPDDVRQKLEEALGKLDSGTPAAAKMKEELLRKLGEQPGAAPAVPSVPPSQYPRTPPAEPPPVAELRLSANRSVRAEVPEGWPLLLTLQVRSDGVSPLHLGSASEPWNSLFKLEAPEAWKLVPAPVSAPEMTLPPGSPGVLSWTMLPEELSALPRGVSVLKASWTTGKEVRSLPVQITLVKAKARLTEDDEIDRAGLLLRCHLLRHDPEGAAKEVDAALQRTRNHPQILALRADLYRATQKPDEALKTMDQAIEAAKKRYRPGDPALEGLRRSRDRLSSETAR